MNRIFTRLRRWPRWLQVIAGGAALLLLGVCGFLSLTLYSQTRSNSGEYIRRWFSDDNSREELTTLRREACPGAPFVLPSDGFIGLLYGDPSGPYNVFNRHTGIDIFGDGAPGEVPVYAVYDGYLTRLDTWLSSVIIRHDDPLNPGQTIWTYYTHMASEDGAESYIDTAFPPGSRDIPVTQGTLLGYQGEYSGNSAFPIGLHVHFSIVESDEEGNFKNESVISNTLDPSPYFKMPLNIDMLPWRPIGCED